MRALRSRALATRALQLKRYELSAASGVGPSCAATTATGHSIVTDLPRAGGGRDTAPQPVELLVAALLGCETATAHYVARQLFPRPYHRLASVAFDDVVAMRDEAGAIALPIREPPAVTAGLVRVSGVARVRPAKADAPLTPADVAELGRIVELRCPVAAMLAGSGCALDFEWRLDG